MKYRTRIAAHLLVSSFALLLSVPASAQQHSSIESLGVRLKLIPGGEFMMGMAGELDDDSHPHLVRVKSFYLSEGEITNAQYRTFQDLSGYKTEAEVRNKPAPRYFDAALFADDSPVIWVSWNDALAFCRWYGGRLPTEAEWEYAAGNGKRHTNYSWGNEKPTTSRGGNVADLTAQLHDGDTATGDFKDYQDGYVTVAPVGTFTANDFGLYDMTGNVWEWCSDWYDETYYRQSPHDNPTGPIDGVEKVRRGGSWSSRPEYAKVYYREVEYPYMMSAFTGFRIAFDVRTVEGSNIR